ncbi:hypothetical protein PR001_g31658 [Phytophthora rubi]|uniref:Uncharacterized protein n=1 Tax=Phytophthora rubi TaxID=129364 RepID=A0A6A3GJ05_9STRA|nr:hypothetical protein PR001_g31658 [Phytophthora rubi]KAE8959465.1 hypothetical protein PR002_g30535 [Phytophthora rubi]
MIAVKSSAGSMITLSITTLSSTLVCLEAAVASLCLTHRRPLLSRFCRDKINIEICILAG